MAGWLALLTAFTNTAWPSDQTVPGTLDQPDNVFLSSIVLPAELKRVLVLPLACDPSSADLLDGCATFNPILLAELIKTQKFEVVAGDPETLRRLTGRLTWTGAEILPADFFDSLQQEYGCDAVLFCQLTVYRTLPPMAVGWRMKLVDVRTGRILWAADDVFDGPRPESPGKAYGFYLPELQLFKNSEARWLKENSPRRFGELSLTAIFSSLPGREKSAKVSIVSADDQIDQRSKHR